MNAAQREKTKEALKTIECLYPSLPVLSKLSGMLKDPYADHSDIGNLIKTDASLTSDIIRISNTVYYGGTTKCSDITNALLRIGQNRVLEAVSLCISRNVFNQDLDHYGISAEDYWTSSVIAGLLMESIAKSLNEDSDKAYTAGILHSVGMTIINRIMSDLCIEMYWDSTIPQTEWEEEITGYNYAIAGAEVLERWKFPREFTNIIRYQVNPEDATNPSSIVECLNFVIHLLNLTGWRIQLHESLELDEACRQFLEKYKINEDHLQSILVNTNDQMKRVMRVFSN